MSIAPLSGYVQRSQTPPSDLDAERAVLSAVMLAPARLADVPSLRREHFYHDPHRLMWGAIQALAIEGIAIDAVTVGSRLREGGSLLACGGVGYLAQVIDATPAVANVATHARMVIDCWRRREVMVRAQHLAAEGYGDVGETDAWIAGAVSSLSEIAESAAELPTLTAVDMARPLPPLHMLIPRLDIGPGAPVLVAGYGFSGKTMACQSLALSVATGRAVWGAEHVTRSGLVLHLDYEQGSRLTSERYQRLAKGMDIDLASLGDSLRLAPYPGFHLDAPDAAARLASLARGCALVIVDSLRACAPSIDENSSEIRRVLDAMSAASEKTGAVFVVIHHARKPSASDLGGAKMAIRGSGAIFDACSSVLTFSGEKNEPVTVSHAKARNTGILADDFAIEISDLASNEDPRWGLSVRASGIAEPGTIDEAKRIRDAVLGHVAAMPGCTQRSVREAVPGRVQSISAAIDDLILCGRLINRGRGSSWSLHIGSGH